MDYTDKIKEWKKQHGALLHVPFSDGREAYLKQPDKRVLGLAYARGAKDPLGIAEVILSNCWLGGDASIKEDVGCLIALQELANELAGKVEASLEYEGANIVIGFEDGAAVMLRKPSRNEASAAMLAARKDPFQMVDSILQSCWLEGDEYVKQSPGHLISLIQAVDEIIGVKSAQVKKI